ncbi:MAG TPA: toll/interleukin-1 receptor domain-containing protein, partial [Chthoniobacterales bacterium]|nr:toll/interleukin-1 receptor domain-containing protein [Chthoniobacterales bacterium]
ILRKTLQAIESEADIITPHDRRTFWRDELFDFGFGMAVIDILATYKFDWGAILPDLYLGKLSSQSETTPLVLPIAFCEKTLHQLLAFALHQGKNSALTHQLRETLKRDGHDSQPTTKEILHALERGQKFDANTMEELKEAGLITMTDARHFQSRGPEYVFTGLTGKGLMLAEGGKTEAGSVVGIKEATQSRTDDSEKKRWDVFISHASEDKNSIAHSLAGALRDRGLEVWYDAFTLKLGDSLRSSIDRGLAQSRFGVVILSEHFFAKHWPLQELNGLAAIEVGGSKVILPVWHGVTREDVARHSPMLADKKAVSTDVGLERVVASILEVVRPEVANAVVYGETSDLHVGTRVQIRKPVAGVPREQWPFDSEIYVIRKTDDQKKTAIATPVLAPLNGPTPTVEGPMTGPHSPFKRANIPS